MTDNRPWLNIYPSGVPANIDMDKYSSVLEMTSQVFKKFNSNPAFTCMGKTISFTELDNYSTQFGAYLSSRGLEPGDKIALMMPNLIQYPIALFGALKAGLIIVNTNPLYTPREMLHQFNDSGAKAIIIAENFAKNLETILPKTQIKTIILTSIGEMLGLKGPIINFVIRKVKKLVPKYNLPNVVSFKQAIKDGKGFSLPNFEKNPGDVILLQYTGGTTGVSKGAMLTNKNMIANMLQISAWMSPYTDGANDTALCPLPLYHIFAFSVNCLALMSNGVHNILVTNPRDIPKLVKTFDKYKVNLTTGVNTLFNALLNNKEFQTLDFSNLKIALGGGAAVQKAIAEQWQKVTGVQLSEGYGMTEAAPVVTVNPLSLGKGRLGCVGLPVPSTDLRIMMENGKLAPVGERGEIQVKGPQVMIGYYNRPEATAETIIDDGWLRTGDIGVMMEDGFFKIVDRLKDMILVSGFNVFPNEIEDVVAAHPKVLEVAAIGIPSERSGEVVKIFVVKKDKSLDKDELIAYCRKNLTGYKIPKEVEFIKELPKSNVGKILRRKLREK